MPWVDKLVESNKIAGGDMCLNYFIRRKHTKKNHYIDYYVSNGSEVS